MKNFNPAVCDAPPLLKQYLGYMLTILGRSGRTVEGYYSDIRFFLRFLILKNTGRAFSFNEILNTDVANISEELILSAGILDAFDFLSFAMTENGNSAAARRRKVSSIKGFYKYICDKTEKLGVNPMEKLESPRVKKALPRYMSLEDSRTLLTSIAGKHVERDFAIITFFLNCGMRVSELVGIKLSSFTDGNRLTILGKGNKERVVYLNNACIEAKQAYDKVRSRYLRDGEDSQYYFLSNRGTCMTTRRVEQMLAEQLVCAGLSSTNITPHKLRHTAATLMYQYGNVDIRLLQEILGHANLSTTEIYTHVSAEQLEMATHASPLATFKKK